LEGGGGEGVGGEGEGVGGEGVGGGEEEEEEEEGCVEEEEEEEEAEDGVEEEAMSGLRGLELLASPLKEVPAAEVALLLTILGTRTATKTTQSSRKGM